MGHRAKKTHAYPAARIVLAALLLASIVLVGVLIFNSNERAMPFGNGIVGRSSFLPVEEHRECSLATSSTLPSALNELKNSISSDCNARGTVSWSAFNGNPETHRGKNVELSDADFKYGTLRLRHPACLRLIENVTVDFSADRDYRVDAGDPQYATPAYRVGFFAAITVETENWLIDLGGHSMTQSRAMNIQQRPYAHISLADRPFRSGQGPADFGADEPVAARRGVIYGGVLARSSHHGIHGNGPAHILIQDLVIRDYEVAGIALNGASDIVVRNVSMEGTSQSIPVRGFYNQARVIVPMVDMILNLGNPGDTSRAPLISARNRLVSLMNDVFEDIATRGLDFIDADLHPEAYALFHNEGGMMDGNAYGVIFHSLGSAVEKFQDEATATPSNIFIENVRIANTVARIREVVALEEVAAETVVKGPVGDVFRIEDVANHANGGVYAGDALSETQMELAARVRHLGFSDEDRRRFFGTLSIGDDMLAWRAGSKSLAEMVKSGRFRYRRNGDTMFHVNKGVFGLRIDGGRDICVRGLDVSGIYNAGARAHTTHLTGEYPYGPVLYNGVGDTGGHPAQGAQLGYMGADARGISVAASRDVVLDGFSVEGVRSEWGWAHGVDIFNGASNCAMQDGSVVAVSTLEGDAAADPSDASIGTKMGRSGGICVAEGAVDVAMHSVSVANVTAGVIGCAYNFLIDPHATLVPRGNNSGTYQHRKIT